MNVHAVTLLAAPTDRPGHTLGSLTLAMVDGFAVSPGRIAVLHTLDGRTRRLGAARFTVWRISSMSTRDSDGSASAFKSPGIWAMYLTGKLSLFRCGGERDLPDSVGAPPFRITDPSFGRRLNVVDDGSSSRALSGRFGGAGVFSTMGNLLTGIFALWAHRQKYAHDDLPRALIGESCATLPFP